MSLSLSDLGDAGQSTHMQPTSSPNSMVCQFEAQLDAEAWAQFDRDAAVGLRWADRRSETAGALKLLHGPHQVREVGALCWGRASLEKGRKRPRWSSVRHRGAHRLLEHGF